MSSLSEAEMELLEATQLACHSSACITSTERRKQERATLMNSVAQLKLQLESLSSEKQRALDDQPSDVQQRIFDNAQIRDALAQEQLRAGEAGTLLQWLCNPMEVEHSISSSRSRRHGKLIRLAYRI